MTPSSSESTSAGKGKAFFDRADQVGDTGNWDFAIELYLEGIQREPGNIQRGHRKLREASLARKIKGGKPAGMMESLKRRPGKDTITNLVNAEYLLAKDPPNLQHMELILKGAQELQLPDLVMWTAGLMFDTLRQTPKPPIRALQQVADIYVGMDEYEKALAVINFAMTHEPANTALQAQAATLSAKYTIQKGKYEQGGDFQKNIRDVEQQRKLMEKDKIAQSSDYLQDEVEQARQAYQANPALQARVNALVDALLKTEDEANEGEAIAVLQKAFDDSGQYGYKMRINDVRNKQMRRRHRKLHDAGDEAAAKQVLRDIVEFEINDFVERVTNYPTDLSLKFELGRRLFAAGRIDEAIGHLQGAQRDPRHQVQATLALGQAFAKKGWYREAANTYEKTLTLEISEERAKEVRYHLGIAFEGMGDLDKAQDQYSQVAMMDFNFKDVRQRLEDVRKKLGEGNK